jgi:hypothetical protein
MRHFARRNISAFSSGLREFWKNWGLDKAPSPAMLLNRNRENLRAGNCEVQWRRCHLVHL